MNRAKFLSAIADVEFRSKPGEEMARAMHYSPTIRQHIVCALYHERKRRGIPMTKLVDEILTGALRDTEAWQIMEEQQHTTNDEGK